MDKPQQSLTFIHNTCFYDAEMESAVIGCAMQIGDSQALEDISENDFYNENAFCIAKCIKLLAGKIDFLTVKHKLHELFADKAKTCENYIFNAMGIPSTVLFKKYKEKVKECAIRRNMYETLARGLEELSKSDSGTDEVAEQIVSKIQAENLHSAGWTSSGDVAMKTIEHLQKIEKGEIQPIKSKISVLDNSIGGFFDGELTIIGARPAIGKSAFANWIAIHAAMAGKKVCVCSREMSDIQYGQRLFSSVGNIDGKMIRKGKIEDGMWGIIGDTCNKIANLPINFLFRTGTIEDLKREVAYKRAQNDCDLLIVDYLQLMRTKKRFENDHMRVSYISKILKNMTLEYNIPIIALAQVRRPATGVKLKMPALEDLKDSGSIEQDADGVIFLHRPENSADDAISPRDKGVFTRYENDDSKQFICVHVAKQRQGQTGAMALVFEPAKMKYEEAWMLR